MSLTINVDSDGVIYDWHGFMIPFLSDRLDTEMTRDHFIEWDLAKSLGVPKAEFYRHFDDAVFEGCFLKGYAIPGAISALRALVDAGHRVRIVTNKQLQGASKTMVAERDFLAWFGQFGLLDRVEVVFTGSRFGKTGYPADLIIDDKPDLSWMQPLAVNVLFDQPWNQDVSEAMAAHRAPERMRAHYHTLGPDVYRAVGWQDVLELVEQIGGGILIDKSPVVV